MEEYQYKEEISNTRVGCLGGSDGNMLAQIASIGMIPKSAYKRLAICKGLIENENITTRAMLYGDYIENEVYKHIKENFPNAESNPLFVSEKYSTKNCKLICHTDIVIRDEDEKVLKLYECKATKFNFAQTRDTYKNQLFLEWLIGKEVASRIDKDWKVQISLCHYDTSEFNIEEGEFSFDPEKLTVRRLNMTGMSFDISLAMNLVNDFLETFDSYFEGDEVDYEYLPSNVKEKFLTITNILKEIKEKEKLVEEFKQTLYSFMLQKDIKGIKSDFFTISRVDPSVSVSFDAKKYLADLRKLHPRKVKKIEQEYRKETKRKGYATIKIKEPKE